MDNARLHRAAEDEIGRRRGGRRNKKRLAASRNKTPRKEYVGDDQFSGESVVQAPGRRGDAAISDRIQALSAAHDLLTRYDWQQIDVGNLVRTEPRRIQRSPKRFRSDRWTASDDQIQPRAVIGFGAARIGTNALKYGAWSVDGGSVDISWRAKDDGKTLDFVWRETGGPTVTPPTQKRLWL